MLYHSGVATTTRKDERNLGLIDGTWLARVVMDESQREMEMDDLPALVAKLSLQSLWLNARRMGEVFGATS